MSWTYLWDQSSIVEGTEVLFNKSKPAWMIVKVAHISNKNDYSLPGLYDPIQKMVYQFTSNEDLIQYLNSNKCLPKGNTMPGYHLREIPRGTFGEYSKVEEEFEEFLDALEQNCNIMAFMELGDFLLALESYYLKLFDGYDFNELIDIIVSREEHISKEQFDGWIGKRSIAVVLRELWEFESMDGILSIIDDWLRIYNLTLRDAKVMSNITRRVFEEGYRTAK